MMSVQEKRYYPWSIHQKMEG